MPWNLLRKCYVLRGVSLIGCRRRGRGGCGLPVSKFCVSQCRLILTGMPFTFPTRGKKVVHVAIRRQLEHQPRVHHGPLISASVGDQFGHAGLNFFLLRDVRTPTLAPPLQSRADRSAIAAV
jgi:hypothetical protein